MRITSILLAIMTASSAFQKARAWMSASSSTGAIGKKSTALDVLKELNQSSKLAAYVKPDSTAIVTGGNSGIGVETVCTLAVSGMKVVLCARNMESANKAREQVPEYCRDNVSIQQLDLADLDSIQQACKEIIEKNDNIQVLVNNAGVMALPKRVQTKQGIEMQVGTNHVGHHMLTRLLLPSLKENGRIVTVASTAHQMSKGGDWDSEESYSAWATYGKSKLANILFAKSLQDKLKEAGRDDISSVSLHPGVIKSNLWRNTPSLFQGVIGLFADKTVEQGAATNVYCALASQVEGGAYYKDCHVETPTTVAHDAALREDLWSYTEKLIADNGYVLPSALVKERATLLETL
jgi:NAD(P)-dependent dehydrogenase (short-subunit alcohol dehydrogenase family)